MGAPAPQGTDQTIKTPFRLNDKRAFLHGGDEAQSSVITYLVIWLAKGERLLYRWGLGKSIGDI